MDSNVIDFETRLPQPAQTPGPDDNSRQTVLELEHEVSELRHAISVLYIELIRQRCG